MLLHGEEGEDGYSSKLFLNILRVPYTHSGVLSSLNAMNKIISKKYLLKIIF